jgi:hypothetical protein
MGGSEETSLTAGQQRFARANRATVGPEGTVGGVFMYRREPWGTVRWLVDRDGTILDQQSFRAEGSPATAAR